MIKFLKIILKILLIFAIILCIFYMSSMKIKEINSAEFAKEIEKMKETIEVKNTIENISEDRNAMVILNANYIAKTKVISTKE